MQDHFVTEFGHRIDFVPGYYEANNTFAASMPDSQFKRQERAIAIRSPQWKPEYAYSGCHKDFVAFSYVAWFLQRWGLLRTWERAIDLGGAEGTFSALLKASGLAAHVTNLDLVDRSLVAPDYQVFLESLANPSPDDIERIRKAKRVFDLFPEHPPMMGLYRKFPHRAAVDAFQHKDIHEASGKYDLVTALLVFDLLDLDAALAKVRNLLTDDGLFLCVDEYWWWAVNSTCIVGHFPYAVQRLTYGDLQRYVGEHHPHLLPSLEARYRYMYAGNTPPTVMDWCAVARRQGLRPIGVERVVARDHHRLGYPMPYILKQPWFNSLEIIRDIRHVKPDVGVDDLTTSIITLAMVKA